MKLVGPILLVVLLVLGLSHAAGDDPPKDEKKYAPMPWHLVDTWWDIGQDTPFESLAVAVRNESIWRSSLPAVLAGAMATTPNDGNFCRWARAAANKKFRINW